MAESRVIRKSFVDSERVNALSWFAECFYHRLLLVADDHGLYDGRVMYLRSQLFGMKLDAVREADLQRGLAECEKAGLVRLYEVEGKPYIEILRYGQRKQSAPKFPPPLTDFHGEPRCVTVKHRLDVAGDGVYRIEDGVAGNATADNGGAGSAHPLPDGYLEWVGKVAMAHPSCSKSRALARDVEDAAVEAFGRCPQAAEAVPLLTAYFADKMAEDRYRKKFYRPVGQAKFFQNLEDVLCHAERWAKETGWKPKAAAKKSEAVAAKQAAREATPEEKDAFLGFLRGKEGG